MHKLDWVIMVVVLATVLLVGGVVMDQFTSDGWRDSVCEDKFGNGSVYVDNSTEDMESFACRLPNGTVVRNVTVELHG